MWGPNKPEVLGVWPLGLRMLTAHYRSDSCLCGVGPGWLRRLVTFLGSRTNLPQKCFSISSVGPLCSPCKKQKFTLFCKWGCQEFWLLNDKLTCPAFTTSSAPILLSQNGSNGNQHRQRIPFYSEYRELTLGQILL